MRQNDRWDEVAGLVVRYRDAGRRRLRPGRSRDRLPAGPHPVGDRAARPGRARTAPSTRARPPASRASAPRSTAPAPSGSGHGVRIADEVADDGTLGPLAQRVRDEQVPLEIAPSSNVQTGAYPSLAEHPVDRLHRLGFAVTLNTDNRLMSGVSATSELADVATHVRLDLGRRPDRHRAALAAAAFLPRARPEAAARRRRPAGVRRAAGLTERDGCHPPLGNRRSDLALLT